MNDFVIYTDSACDIPPELLKEWGVPYSWLTYVFDGDARQYSNYELPFPEFYDKMRKGSVARTSAVNADAFVFLGSERHIPRRVHRRAGAARKVSRARHPLR